MLLLASFKNSAYTVSMFVPNVFYGINVSGIPVITTFTMPISILRVFPVFNTMIPSSNNAPSASL
jgi:hypothetical protein